MQRQRAIQGRMAAWLRTQGPAAILTPSFRQYNILNTGGHLDGRLARDSVYEPSVQLLVSLEHYGQIWRNVKRGIAVRLELNVQNRFVDTDRHAYNTLGDIAGTDKAAEFVMLGGHIDSWQAGTGTSDNGVGVAVMMEAARILKTLNLPLRRTVRVGFWSGEEQGLLGSRHWVRMHPDLLPRISAYVNIDNGGGRVRGVYDQMNGAVAPIFEQILFPFRDLGVMTVRHENTGGTDHLSFDAAGVPGFQFIQDPLEYGIRIHHTNGDTMERIGDRRPAADRGRRGVDGVRVRQPRRDDPAQAAAAGGAGRGAQELDAQTHRRTGRRTDGQAHRRAVGQAD